MVSGSSLGQPCSPHYGPDEESRGQLWSQQHGIAVLGIPECSGMKSSAGQARVLGQEPIHLISEAGTMAVSPGDPYPQ